MSLMKKFDDLSGNYKVRKAWLTFAMTIFLVVIVIPAIFVVTKIFTEWDLVTNVLNDPSTMTMIEGAVWNSFSIAFIVTMIDILVGLPMAWIMVRRNFKGKKWLDTLLDIPLAFPTAVLGISVVIFWGAPEGVAIPGLGLDLSPYVMMILLHILFTYPYMVRSLSGILEQIDVNYETAAMTLGASKWTAVRTITVPLFRAGLATGFILCFARSLSETGGTYIALSMLGVDSTFFTGPSFISWLKHDSAAVDSGEMMGAMILISVVMIILALLLLVVVKWIIKRFKVPVKKVWPDIGRKVSRGFLPKTKDVLTIAFLILIVLVPSFYIFTFLTQPIPEIDYGGLFGSIGISVFVAGVAVVVDIILGVPMALYIARNHNGKLANIMDGLVNVPLIIPTTALGFSLALFWNSIVAEGSMDLLLVILGHISFTYPLVVRNLIGAIEEVNPECEEIAMTLGAKPFQAFRKILMPIIKSSVMAGGILAFTRSLGETGATTSITSSVNTVPVYITDLVKAGEYTEAAMCSIVLIIICFILMLTVRALTHRRQGRDA
ncbi:ABC transporter permease [Candidatus Methanoprimaticola sp. MG2]|uniref:ABC transporter permease n=1 Tax=Candidatus Methanoprimaticola sp. MG2 TaxID=3228838 RepID=UPI0039C6BA56